MRNRMVFGLVGLLWCSLYPLTEAEAVDPRQHLSVEQSRGADDSLPESPRLALLRKELAKGNAAALDEFWTEIGRHGAPLIEPAPGKDKHQLVTFVWRAKDEARVVVMSEFGHSVRSRLLIRLPNSDLWHKTFTMPDDARFLYQLSVNDPKFPFESGPVTDYPTKFQTDPLNPKKWGQSHSLAELRAAPPLTLSTANPDVPKGLFGRLPTNFKSTILGNERKILIYKPPGFTTDGDRYPLLVFGASYTSMVPMPTILDNMIAKRLIPPVVAVFVDHPAGAQDRELSCDPRFADFLAKELVPAMRDRLHATTDPKRTVIGGASQSGLSAAHVALTHPDVFGNVLSQSGSFWWAPDGDPEDQWLTRQIAAKPAVPVRFFLSIGTLESGFAFRDGLVSMLHANRHLRDVLKAKGNMVAYKEVSGGHDPYNWQIALPDGLIALIGKDTSRPK